jgi:hypothetical protein
MNPFRKSLDWRLNRNPTNLGYRVLMASKYLLNL